MAGYHNNNLQNAGADATPEEIGRIIDYALDTFEAKVPDLHNAEEVHAAIVGYFESCKRRGIRPGNLGLYAALGMSKQEVHHAVVTERDKNKVSPEVRDLIKKAQRAMSQYREGLATAGRLNPATYIFMGKNFDGLSDDPQIRVEISGNQDRMQLSQEELQRRIPVYSDYEQAAPAAGTEDSNT